MQYFRVTVKMTESSWFVSSQTIQYHSNPNLCPNHWCWRSWSWTALWRPTRPCRTNTQKRCYFHHRGLECKSRKKEIPGVRGKFGLRVQNEAGQRLTEFYQENALVIANILFQHMDIMRWLISKLDWLYSLQSKMETLSTVSKKTGSWLWLRSWTLYCQIQT